jgi:hypothetical protein
MSSATVKIGPCPVCSQPLHEYPLEVGRSVIVHLTSKKPARPVQQEKFVRLFTCPVKDEPFQAELTRTNSALEVKSVTAVTPHNKALYEAGKKLLGDSLDAGREFCKSMITTSLGAIPVYLALISLALPKEYRPTASEGHVFLIPSALFLAAAIVFTLGFFREARQLPWISLVRSTMLGSHTSNSDETRPAWVSSCLLSLLYSRF